MNLLPIFQGVAVHAASRHAGPLPSVSTASVMRIMTIKDERELNAVLENDHQA